MAVFGLPQAHGNDAERASPPSHPESQLLRSVLAAYYTDDPARLDLETLARYPVGTPAIWAFFAEHGLLAPDWMVSYLHRSGPGGRDAIYADVADALASGDNARLGEAIDAAEARHLVPFVARMRIVLARRTGDRAELERARPVLERLGDRQGLRRLAEVAAALGG